MSLPLGFLLLYWFIGSLISTRYLYGGKRMEYDLTLNISRFTRLLTFRADNCAARLRGWVQRQGRTAPAERGVDPIGDASGGD